MNSIIANIPEMKTGTELAAALTVLPEYNSDICSKNQAIRLMALSDIYNVYIPSKMTIEIYNKLYLALLRSLNKKGAVSATQQRYQNYKAVKQQEHNSIIGGADSFTIIGTSGIGKSAAINKAISLMSENKVIITDEPYTKIIPCVVVQCPFDSSVKGLLLEILRKIDEDIGSKYYEYALRARYTTDMIIGAVSQAALNHIGLLVVDEIQNVANSKNGKSLIGSLTQLINNSGISICMVGTPESKVFFEQALQLARRSVGLCYSAMPYDDYFKNLCCILFKYQYTQNKTEISDMYIEWLYQHSAGIVSVVVSLLHDSQEIAILNGIEEINLDTLNTAYKQRLSLLHSYIEPSVIHKAKTSKAVQKQEKYAEIADVNNSDVTIKQLADKAKREDVDIIALLRKYFAVEVVKI